jgi:hypothetical protein
MYVVVRGLINHAKTDDGGSDVLPSSQMARMRRSTRTCLQ